MTLSSPQSRSEQIARARELRRNPTPAEKLLWSVLRNKAVEGRKFRRQCPIGKYFADFVCLSDRLIVEVDGAQHAEPSQARHDRLRTVWLNRQRFRVLRFWNGEVLNELAMVRAIIVEALRNPGSVENPPPSPRP